MLQGLHEEVIGTEVAGLQRQVQAFFSSGIASGITPGNTRVDLRANLHLGHPQVLHTGARRFSTGHHQQEAFDKWRAEILPIYKSTETRKGYAKNLRHLEPVFGQAGWHEISLQVLRGYLDRRTAKIQGNRELALLSVIWGKARLWGLTEIPWPAAGIKGWKNVEQAREFEFTDELFSMIYEFADDVLRDAIDIATATGLRLGDVRTLGMPVDGQLRFKSSKTGKLAYFELSQSKILQDVVRRRGKRNSTMLLTTSTGRPVSQSMLRGRYDKARRLAAAAYPSYADQITSMYLRDTRKRAADLAENLEQASHLLQHSSIKLTETHYRSKPTKLKAVR